MRTAPVLVSMVVVALMTHDAQADRRSAAVTAAMVAALTPERPALSTGEHRLAGPARLPAQLEIDDVTAGVSPRREDIERCYLEQVRGAQPGQLDVLFEIGRDGKVRSVAAAAPALTPYTAPVVTRCIRAIAAAVQFPARRNDTTVVVPYLFHKVIAPDAGPQLSCWSPKGCRR